MSQTKAQLIDPVDLSIVTADLADDAVTAAKLASNAVVNASVDSSAAIDGTKINPNFGSQAIQTSAGIAIGGNITIENVAPKIFFTDSDTNSDFSLRNMHGVFGIRDQTNSADRFTVASDGTVNVANNLDVGAGVDVTGNITTTGSITITSAAPNLLFTESDDNPDFGVLLSAGQLKFQDVTNTANIFTLDSNKIQAVANLDALAGIDVTGNIVGTADLTVNTNTLKVDSSNSRVGIGTASPEEILHIHNASNSPCDFRISNSEGYGFIRSDSNLLAYNAQLHLFANRDRSTEFMRIDGSGRLGIGTTSPNSTTLMHISAQQSGTATGTGITLSGWNGSAESRVQIMSFGIGSGTLAIRNTTSNTEVLRIDDSGKVGIGTTSPGSVLHVDKGLSGSPLVTFHQTAGNSSADAGLEVETSSTGTYIQRWVNSGSEKMRVTGNGLVGIGTNSPATQLHVSSGFDTIIRVTSADGAAAFLDLGDVSDPDGGRIHYDSGSNLVFNTDSNERMRIDSSGRMLIGTSASLGVFGLAAQIQVAGDTAGESSLALRRFGNSAQGAFLTFSKSRNAADGSRTIVQDGDELGRVAFCADDGTDLVTGAAEIQANVDGTPGSNDMPGRLTFHTTADGSETLSERMRIDSSGKVAIGLNDAKDNHLLVRGSSTVGTKNGHIMLSGDSATAGQGPQIVFSESGVSGTFAGAYIGHLREGSNSMGPLVFGTRGTTGDIDSVPSERMRIQADGMIGIGTTGPKAGLHVATENATYGKNAVFGANGWVNNANYHYTDSTISLLGQDASGNNKGAGIEFTARNSGDSNWMHGSINMERDGDFVHIAGGAGTTQGTERIRVKAGGDLYFGDYLGGGTNQPRVFFLSEDGNLPDQSNRLGLRISNGYSDASIRAYGNSSSWNHVKFYSTHLSGGTITTAGSISMSGGNTIAYNTSSDYRLKENEVLISDGITRLKQLKPYRFNWKTDTSKKVDGFYAHEVSGIVPEAISGEKDAVVTQAMIDAGEIDEAIGTPVYQGIDQAKLVPLLTAALQEAIAKIETLETEVAALKAA